MNYLTNYYKNLCEELQQKINLLEARLPDFGGVVAAYVDTPQDRAPIATRRRDEQEDLSIDYVGSEFFGGKCMNPNCIVFLFH